MTSGQMLFLNDSEIIQERRQAWRIKIYFGVGLAVSCYKLSSAMQVTQIIHFIEEACKCIAWCDTYTLVDWEINQRWCVPHMKA